MDIKLAQEFYGLRKLSSKSNSFLIVQARLAHADHIGETIQMRREEFGVGTYVHVIKRGARGIGITRDAIDKRRFLKLLRYLNDENVPRNWERDLSGEHLGNEFKRPGHWPDPKPYVSILAFCLLDNHFHLLLREKSEAGISRFMQRLCTSMSLYFNARHEEKGTLFQGPYKAVVIRSDRQLQYVHAYVQIKNSFERLRWPNDKVLKKFDEALVCAASDPFNSFGDYMGQRHSGILDMEAVRDALLSPDVFTTFAHDVIAGREEYGRKVDELE